MKYLKIIINVILAIIVLNLGIKCFDFVSNLGTFGPVLIPILLIIVAFVICYLFGDKIVNKLEKGDK